MLTDIADHSRERDLDVDWTLPIIHADVTSMLTDYSPIIRVQVPDLLGPKA